MCIFPKGKGEFCILERVFQHVWPVSMLIMLAHLRNQEIRREMGILLKVFADAAEV